MAQWQIEPKMKKSLIERVHYHKDNNEIIIETGWRWGKFELTTEDDIPPKLPIGVDLYNCDYDVDLIETTDGWWENHDTSDCDDETVEWFNNFIEEGNSYYALEEHDWFQGDTEMIVDCDIVITPIDE